MPKFGAHIIFAEEAARRRPDLFNNTHHEALRFGAIGPDTSLFLLDPVGKLPHLREGFAKLLDVLRTIQRIKGDIQKVADELTKPVADLQNWLSGGLSEDLRYTLNASIEAMFLAAKLGIAWGVGTINIRNPAIDMFRKLPHELIDNPYALIENWTIHGADNFGFPFRLFGHPYTSDGQWKQPLPTGDYSKWWWMDLLHYRKTGEFARRLLDTAAGPLQTSYARGYLTHVGGDICGHPYINSLVGGPFRNHAYRHMVLETLVDVRLWDHQRGADIMDAQIDALIELSDGEAEEIGELVVRAMRDTYQPPMVPDCLANGYPTAGEWVFAYRTMQQYLRLSTGGAFPRPKPPPSTPREIIEEIKNLLKDNVPGGPPTWDGNIEEFLKSLFSWAGKGMALLVMIMTLPAAVISRILAVAPRWIIYLLNLAIYYVISAIRTLLCLSGWGYCSRDDMSNFAFLDDMISTPAPDDYTYPRETVPTPKPPFYWLQAPAYAIPNSAPLELPETYAMAPDDKGLTPDWLVDPANQMDLEAILRLADAATPAETQLIEQTYRRISVFGNAVDFSNAMLDGEVPIYDFDLDGDRGYGFLPWEGLPPTSRYL